MTFHAMPSDPAPREAFAARDWLGPFRARRLLVVALLLALALWPGAVGEITRAQFRDAYVQVSTFVAATLLIFYGAEKFLHFDIGRSLKSAGIWQVPIASFMGALPGCGGAVVVVAGYSAGNLSFGAVVATLTATMGDAAFLLIAVRPDAAAVVLPLSFVLGVVWGWAIDRFNRVEFRVDAGAQCNLAPLIGAPRWRDRAALALMLPGLFFAVQQIFQVDLFAHYGWSVDAVGLAGAGLALLIWATSPLQSMTHAGDAPITRAAEETSFISVWVISAYLAYALVAEVLGLDLRALFATVAPLLPLMGILVGLVPGCGPQILVTTLYVNGLIPFAALIGNAISNDGDALFPAIAMNPRAAIWATIYSTLPALVVAYAFWFFAPGFLN